MKLLLACLAIESILAILSSFTGPIYSYVTLWDSPRFGASVYRAIGTVDSPNNLGGLMAFGALVCCFAPASVLPVRRIVILPGLLVAVVLSQSKSAALAVLVVFSAIGLASIDWRRATIRALSKAAFSYAVAGVLVTYIFSLYGDAILDNLTNDYIERAAIGENVISKFGDFNWAQKAFGAGFHGADFIDPATHAWITAHNSYVDLIADLGICGAGLVFAFLIVLIPTQLRRREWHLLAGTLGLLLHFGTEEFLYAPVFVMTIGTIYGMTFASPCILSGRRRMNPAKLKCIPTKPAMAV